MAFKDMRSFINLLRQEKETIEIKEEIDPKYEVAAILRNLDKRGGPAVIFNNIKGYNIPIVGNLLATRRRIAWALETNEKSIVNEYLKRMEKEPIPPKLVKDGPVKEVVLKKGLDLLQTMPIVTYHERDVGPYISAGVIFSRNPETGKRSMGIHRLQIKGKNKTGIAIWSPALGENYARADERNEALEVAIAIGVEPVTIIASVTWGKLGDKLEIAGVLRGEPLEMVKCETVNIEAPAHAEIVIEGKILPKIREKEGPVGDGAGIYSAFPEMPIVEVSAITHRVKPMYHAIVAVTKDAMGMLESIWEAEVYKSLKELIPSVKAVHITPGSCLGNIIISIKKQSEGDPRRALLLTLMHNPYFKKAIVVNEDVDIYDPQDVEWAMTTGFQADKDLLIIPDVGGTPFDLTAKEGYMHTKVGIDATKPMGRAEMFERIKVPKECEIKTDEILKNYF